MRILLNTPLWEFLMNTVNLNPTFLLEKAKCVKQEAE